MSIEACLCLKQYLSMETIKEPCHCLLCLRETQDSSSLPFSDVSPTSSPTRCPDPLTLVYAVVFRHPVLSGVFYVCPRPVPELSGHLASSVYVRWLHWWDVFILKWTPHCGVVRHLQKTCRVRIQPRPASTPSPRHSELTDPRAPGQN